MRVMTKAEIDPWDNPNPTGVRLTKRTALRVPELPSPVPSAEGDRRVREERQAALERARAMSVVLAQPHRRGSDDLRLSEPFGRFCAAQRLGEHCWLAGVRYAEIIRQEKQARGFGVYGWAPSDGGYDIAKLTPEQIEAMREAAILRLTTANWILRGVMPRLPGSLERLVYEQLEPAIRDEAMLIHGLVALAIGWGMLKNDNRGLTGPGK